MLKLVPLRDLPLIRVHFPKENKMICVMTTFHRNYKNTSLFLFLMLIRPIIIETPHFNKEKEGDSGSCCEMTTCKSAAVLA